MVEMVTFWSAMRRDSGYFAPWPHQASEYIIGLNCDDQRAHETPLAGSLRLHLRIRYNEVAYFTQTATSRQHGHRFRPFIAWDVERNHYLNILQ